MKQILLFLCLSLLTFTEGRSIMLSPQAQISLLTCSAGNAEIYSYYGHSAIRVKDPAGNLDLVFNYGVFNFESPHFIWRFCKGETDYQLAMQSIGSFMENYYEVRQDVYEQVLNLTPEERQSLFDALIENNKPENRYYRYNHFLDNCATRIRDQFEKVTSGKLQYNTSTDKSLTFRNMLDECLPDNSWSGFGIKLALGIPCDRKTTFREKMFLPGYLQSDMTNAVIIRNGDKVPFTLPVQTLYKAPPLPEEPVLTSPAVVVLLLFLITLFFSVREYKTNKKFIWLDFAIYLGFGIAGLILGFLCFISELEATGWNLNLIWALPTHFIFAFILLIPSLRQRFSWYPRIVSYILIGFLVLMFVLPQTFHWLVVPLCLTLLLRTTGISRMIELLKKRKSIGQAYSLKNV